MRSEQYDILVVEDDPDDRMIMGQAFSELGCANRVTMYDGGFSFMRDMVEIAALAPLPRLIVLDYNLPGVKGDVILERLKQDNALGTISVVMYSSGMSLYQQADCLTKGAVQCFEKGSTYKELLSFCKQVCEMAFGHRASV